MAEIFKIPVSSDHASFREYVELDGVQYLFQFDWNDRETGWFLRISDANGNVLISGVALNVNEDLLSQFVGANLPQGILMLYDASGKNEACGRNDLGTRCHLLYRSTL